MDYNFNYNHKAVVPQPRDPYPGSNVTVFHGSVDRCPVEGGVASGVGQGGAVESGDGGILESLGGGLGGAMKGQGGGQGGGNRRQGGGLGGAVESLGGGLGGAMKGQGGGQGGTLRKGGGRGGTVESLGGGMGGAVKRQGGAVEGGDGGTMESLGGGKGGALEEVTGGQGEALERVRADVTRNRHTRPQRLVTRPESSRVDSSSDKVINIVKDRFTIVSGYVSAINKYSNQKKGGTYEIPAIQYDGSCVLCKFGNTCLGTACMRLKGRK